MCATFNGVPSNWGCRPPTASVAVHVPPPGVAYLLTQQNGDPIFVGQRNFINYSLHHSATPSTSPIDRVHDAQRAAIARMEQQVQQNTTEPLKAGQMEAAQKMMDFYEDQAETVAFSRSLSHYSSVPIAALGQETRLGQASSQGGRACV